MFLRGRFGQTAGALIVALLVAFGAWPAHLAQAADSGRIDLAAMALYPADIAELELGETCLSTNLHFRAEMGEQDDLKAFLTFDRVPQVEEEIDDLVGDGGLVSIFSMTTNQGCEYLEGERIGEYYTVKTDVLEQERRSDARKAFDLVSDSSVLLPDPDEAEWESLDEPELGDEAALEVGWSLEDGERDYFTEIVLTVRVDRLVGQVTFVANGMSDGEPDIDPILEAGELLAERMEEGLNAKRMPAKTALWLVDLDDDDDTVLSPLYPEYYPVFNGDFTFPVTTTADNLEAGQQIVEERGIVSRYTRNYVYEVREELVGYVEVGYFQYASGRDAEADLDTRLDASTEASPDVEYEPVDLEWGDESLLLKASSENEEGGTDVWYVGYIVVGDEMAFIQLNLYDRDNDLDLFEFLMDHQETCMESRTGCEAPIAAEELFG